MDTTIILFWLWTVIVKGYVGATISPFFLSPTRLNWASSQSYCERNQGRLVTIDTLYKYNQTWIIDKSFHDSKIFSSEMYIGLSTKSLNCTDYVWSDGQPLEWSKWDLSMREPNGCESEQCVRLYFGLFRTISCSLIYPAICEYVTPKSSTSTSIPTTGSVTANISISCDCCTRGHINGTKLNQTELLQIITQLKAELSVNKSQTSSFRRKRISAYESRPSSMVMGGVACVILSIMIGWIVVPDTITLCVFLFRCVNNPTAITPKV